LLQSYCLFRIIVISFADKTKKYPFYFVLSSLIRNFVPVFTKKIFYKPIEYEYYITKKSVYAGNHGDARDAGVGDSRSTGNCRNGIVGNLE
jgi:hypothetical protein